jgi:AraC-like DNA-binding protein/CheY-like chemotaxis protein
MPDRHLDLITSRRKHRPEVGCAAIVIEWSLFLSCSNRLSVAISYRDRMERRLDSRFAIVTSGHRFLVRVLPLSAQGSLDALREFVNALAHCDCALPDVETILLRCLFAIDASGRPRSHNLVEQYLAHGGWPDDCTSVFTQCVEGAIRAQTVASPPVRQAIRIIEQSYHDSHLSHATVARQVSLSSSALSVAFKAHVGCTFTEYRRNYRLDQAALLLRTTGHSIKEIWVRVGYNFGSNFYHQFKKRFGTAPSTYRSAARADTTKSDACVTVDRNAQPASGEAAQQAATILIVDDDEGTREAVGEHLRRSGYATIVARSGTEAIHETRRILPTAIILDYCLPDMDGLQCLRFLRSDKRLAPTRVALFTADWSIYQYSDEIRRLNATIVSKLCTLDDLSGLAARLTQQNELPIGSQ